MGFVFGIRVDASKVELLSVPRQSTASLSARCPRVRSYGMGTSGPVRPARGPSNWMGPAGRFGRRSGADMRVVKGPVSASRQGAESAAQFGRAKLSARTSARSNEFEMVFGAFHIAENLVPACNRFRCAVKFLFGQAYFAVSSGSTGTTGCPENDQT